jgi:hypothetical protein
MYKCSQNEMDIGGFGGQHRIINKPGDKAVG